MFKLIKLVIYLAGIIAIAYFALPYFGYELNLKYLTESKETCQKRLQECSDQLLLKGIENPSCNPTQCVDRSLIIKKK